MGEKKVVEVLIAGEKYRLGGYESTEYMHRIAAYINSKYDEIEAQNLHINSDMKDVLIKFNIADDYFKAKSELEQLKKDCEDTDKLLFNLKHELANVKDKLDKETERNRELNDKLNRFRR